LNRFDNILENFCKYYQLNEGPQMQDFGRSLLLNQCEGLDFGVDTPNASYLTSLGYGEDGDRQLIEAILRFTRMLLEHSGNRSIYASSAHLNDLLHTTSMSILRATLEVGSELAQRYQASVKRAGSVSRQISTALLSNHYNIDLERVLQLALPFVKTPIVSPAETLLGSTPGSSSKANEKAATHTQKPLTSMVANDLVAVASADESRWADWGDVKLSYYLQTTGPSETTSSSVPDHGFSSVPSTPTPLRRSSTMGTPQYSTPRSGRHIGVEDTSPLASRGLSNSTEDTSSSQRTLEIPQTVVVSSSIYELLQRCPVDIPKTSRYEFLNRLRVAKAIVGSAESRREALAVRLLAITNLAYIHPEATFVEKALRQDADETRRFQLVYQLAELIRPSADGVTLVPLSLQAIALALLEAISNFQARYQDVLSALNANVNHGILLYVIRKAVAGMKEDPEGDDGSQITEADEWRNNLFSLTLHMSMATRIGNEMVSAGLMEILVEILTTRSRIAQRNHSMVLAFLDQLIWAYPNAFQAFFNAEGLDTVSTLVVTTVKEARQLSLAGNGTKPENRSQIVDYEIPFYQQQTLKWLLKFVHHVMSNSFSFGANTERLLRNLVDKSDLLKSLQHIIENTKTFGSVVWTNSATILSDFINNDPTSFAAITEAGMIKSYLEAITGRPVSEEQPTQQTDTQQDNEDPDSPDSSDSSIVPEEDSRPHPPPLEALETTRDRPLARGILASAEAINVVPQVLNSISLNNAGLRMVVSSHAFESFFEIFESPAHVHCMEVDPDLATNVGNSFDELARHHPNLRTGISNAVIDMVARVNYFGKSKAAKCGWGAKLLLHDEGGKLVVADETLEDQLSKSPIAAEGKGKAAASDNDVEMADAAVGETNGQDAVATPIIDRQSDTATPYDDITPYIYVLANFLSSYLSNSTLKTLFIQRGGIELLLDISESPSLPFDFGESHASRTLHHVISQLIEQAPVLGLPSLLKRTQIAVNALTPLTLDADPASSYFAQFLTLKTPLSAETFASLEDQERARLTGGTKLVKALVNAQSFISTLYECFTSSSRSSTLHIYPINVFDYYIRLVESLGPLLRAVLVEESAQYNVVPQHWLARKPVATETAGNTAKTTTNSGDIEAGDDTSLPDVLGGTATWRSSDDSQPNTQSRRPSKQEQSTARYRNFETLRLLLHSMMPTTFPFFQQLGKALLPRRDQRDSYSRPRHLEIARVLAGAVLDQLRPSMASNETSSKRFHYWIIMLHTIHEILVDRKYQL
jgi:E3 ubiquitin-protein ligase HUWE1